MRSHWHCQTTFGTTHGQTLSLLHQNQTKTTSSPHFPLHSGHYSQGIPLSLSPSPLPPPPSQGSAHFRKHRLRFGRGKRERGIFLRHDSLGFPHQGMEFLVGAAPRPGWAVDPTEERGMEGATRGAALGWGSGESTHWGASLPREAAGSGPWKQNHLGMLRAGGELGTPLCSSPNSCPKPPQTQQRDTTGCSHPAQGQTAQQWSHRVPPGPPDPPKSPDPPTPRAPSLLCPRPCPLLIKAL